MKRLTFDGNFCDICVWPVRGGSYCKNGECSQRKTWERLKAIEDILGDEYDLDRLRELAQADREGRCVVLPPAEYTDEDGEKALKNAMFVCGLTNNATNRYTADAIAEKLTREAAEKLVCKSVEKALGEMEDNRND